MLFYFECNFWLRSRYYAALKRHIAFKYYRQSYPCSRHRNICSSSIGGGSIRFCSSCYCAVFICNNYKRHFRNAHDFKLKGVSTRSQKSRYLCGHFPRIRAGVQPQVLETSNSLWRIFGLFIRYILEWKVLH